MPVGVIDAKPLKKIELLITFDTGEQRVYDVNPLINTLPLFAKLRDINIFNQVYVDKIMDTVAWDENTDICPDSLYNDSVSLS